MYALLLICLFLTLALNAISILTLSNKVAKKTLKTNKQKNIGETTGTLDKRLKESWKQTSAVCEHHIKNSHIIDWEEVKGHRSEVSGWPEKDQKGHSYPALRPSLDRDKVTISLSIYNRPLSCPHLGHVMTTEPIL